jgi:hypothetical protein
MRDHPGEVAEIQRRQVERAARRRKVAPAGLGMLQHAVDDAGPVESGDREPPGESGGLEPADSGPTGMIGG